MQRSQPFCLYAQDHVPVRTELDICMIKMFEKQLVRRTLVKRKQKAVILYTAVVERVARVVPRHTPLEGIGHNENAAKDTAFEFKEE